MTLSTVNSRIKSAKKRRKKRKASPKAKRKLSKKASKRLPIKTAKKKAHRKPANSRIKAARKPPKHTSAQKSRSDAAKKGWETRRKRKAERVFASLPPREPPGPPSEPPSSEKPISSRSLRLMEELEREREARRIAEETARKQMADDAQERDRLRRRADEAEKRWEDEVRAKESLPPEDWEETDESVIYHRMIRAERLGLDRMEAAYLSVEYGKTLREVYEIIHSPGKFGISVETLESLVA